MTIVAAEVVAAIAVIGVVQVVIDGPVARIRAILGGVRVLNVGVVAKMVGSAAEIASAVEAAGHHTATVEAAVVDVRLDLY